MQLVVIDIAFYSMGNTILSLVSLPHDVQYIALRETYLSVLAEEMFIPFTSFVKCIGHSSERDRQTNADMSSVCTSSARFS
jgi:hypothetical protein